MTETTSEHIHHGVSLEVCEALSQMQQLPSHEYPRQACDGTEGPQSAHLPWTNGPLSSSLRRTAVSRESSVHQTKPIAGDPVDET